MEGSLHTLPTTVVLVKLIITGLIQDSSLFNMTTLVWSLRRTCGSHVAKPSQLQLFPGTLYLELEKN